MVEGGRASALTVLDIQAYGRSGAVAARRQGADMSTTVAGLPIAKSDRAIELLPRMANRHGLIAGATGTGKTITLRVLTEHFSSIGVPVFLADVKGDLAGLARAGGDSPKVVERARQLGIELKPAPCPVVFWDLFGAQGHPVRATVSEMGPQLLARLLGLNDTQAGVLSIVFKVADDGGLLLLDLKDLRAMLEDVGKHAAELKVKYGNVSAGMPGIPSVSFKTSGRMGLDVARRL